MPMLIVGQRVKHSVKPEWGPGEVLAVSSGGKATIYFAMVGQRTLKDAPVLVVEGEEGRHPLLDNRIRSQNRGAKSRSMADMKTAFIKLFPGGFYDPFFLEDERNYKVEASEQLANELGKEAVTQLLLECNHDEICRRALSVVNATNLIFPNEKMSLKDGLRDLDNRKQFARTLVDLLHGDRPFETRFHVFLRALGELGASKWTTATYFPFLAYPQEHMFLKPEVTQQAATACDFELHYRSEPNFATYAALLEFCSALKTITADLAPRDMIDLQSFIWCIGRKG